MKIELEKWEAKEEKNSEVHKYFSIYIQFIDPETMHDIIEIGVI